MQEAKSADTRCGVFQCEKRSRLTRAAISVRLHEQPDLLRKCPPVAEHAHEIDPLNKKHRRHRARACPREHVKDFVRKNLVGKDAVFSGKAETQCAELTVEIRRFDIGYERGPVMTEGDEREAAGAFSAIGWSMFAEIAEHVLS